ncbi:MAG: 5'-3' exonuclease [Mycobacteriales bacterium]
MTPSILLLDAASLYFRAFYGVPPSVRAPDGRPVNAIRGFLETTTRLLREDPVRGLVVCLDLDWRPAFRVAAVDSYKTHRVDPESATGAEQVPDALASQVPVLLEVLAAAGLVVAGAPGFEADDVIATLAYSPGHAALRPVTVVTGDRDLFALAGEGVDVRYAVERMRRYTASSVALRFDIPPGTYLDFALLRGDPSDGLPGVRGIGERTAGLLLRRFGSLDALLTAIDCGDVQGVPAGVLARLDNSRDYLAAARVVVTPRTDVPLEVLDASLPASPVHPERLRALSEEHGLAGPVARLVSALQRVTDG